MIGDPLSVQQSIKYHFLRPTGSYDVRFCHALPAHNAALNGVESDLDVISAPHADQLHFGRTPDFEAILPGFAP